ncbi:helix-hairpin-helix domain-containing protein [Solirubrobacter phytolaccae]|uniref:Helix-hairpin-helix domain-containing protein n=1 Tax=Solirubrobacter phytolaccae TaxID=1404360 RepID=A0A9X3NIA1_9ACTN|nr:helix-hairpin-helix domain-containing protein [Solirubrobacter phytolaccae]MDA0181782.1 helix-hairpin-helix domain-containing protein [Solirubrobacter phytolaccae]
MPERDPRRMAAWAAAGVVLALLAAWYLARSRPTADAAPPPAVATIAAAQEPTAEPGAAARGTKVVVDVSGAVKRPGVYSLTTQDRVEDALERAGGATRRADVTQLNRAAKLEDGRQILVPTRGKVATATAPTTPGGAAAAPEGPINLNTATLEQLDTLDGVGPATAQKIIEYREQHGGFKTVDELDQVSGIGEKRLATLRERVTV